MISTMIEIKSVEQILGDLTKLFKISAEIEELVERTPGVTQDFVLSALEAEGKNTEIFIAMDKTGASLSDVRTVEKAVVQNAQGDHGSVTQKAKQEQAEAFVASSTTSTTASREAAKAAMASAETKEIVAQKEASKKEEKAEVEMVKLEKPTVEQAVSNYDAAKEAGMLPAPYVHNKVDIQKDERGFAKNIALATDFAVTRNGVVATPFAMQPKRTFASSVSLAA